MQLTKVDNKIINDNKTIILDAEFFQNVDAYNNYSSGRIAAINNICNKNTERTVNAIGVAMNTFGCVTGIATIFATGGIALIPEGLGTILSCYGAVSGIYDAFTKGNVTEKYLGANGECAFKGAGIGYGVLFDCVRGTVGNNIEGIIKCTSHLIGSEADLYGCGCKEDPNKNAATSTGDPHITTFDGLYFDFQGYGEFIATKSTSDNFEVQIRQEDLHSSGKVTMNTAIAVQTGSDVVSIMMKPNRLFINNQAQNFASFTFQALKNGATINKIKIENYEVINISLKNGDLIKVNFHGSSFLDYSISPSINRKSKLIGILGNYDSDKLNDVQVRNGENILKDGKLPFGKLYSSYADSWRITNANSLFYYDSGKNTDSYTQKSFPPIEQNITAEQKFKAETICRNAGITTEPYLSNCIVDVAITNDLTLANSSAWGQNNNTFPANKPVPIVPEPIDLKKITITSSDSKNTSNYHKKKMIA